MTYKEIAVYFKLSNGAIIQKLMDKYKLPRRKPINRNQFGKRNVNWNGGKKMLNGYILIRNVEHPRNTNGYIPEHILKMETKIGRPLKVYGLNDSRNETVHHKDGNKKNNSLRNLKLMTFGEHISLHNSWRKPIKRRRDALGRFKGGHF